jgi:hypothetical protein
MDSLEPRRCTATNRHGERCGRAPIAGGTVCIPHGGGAPAVQQAAKARLVAMVEPVLGAFEEILAIWRGTRCETCGNPTGDPGPVIQVGRLVLDRAGFHPTLTVEQVAAPNQYADYSEDQLIARLEAMLADAIARRDHHRAHSLPAGVIEAAIDEGFEVPEEDGPVADAPIPSATNTPEDWTTDDEAAK